MARNKLPEDRTVLQAKFENANRLVQVYGDGIARVKAELETLRIVKPDASFEEMLLNVKESMLTLSKAGIDKSLIDDDLKHTVASFGEQLPQLIQQHFANLAYVAKSGIQAVNIPQMTQIERDNSVVASIIDAMEQMLLPARELRDRLQNQLNRVRKEQVETTGQENRRMRDERIRALAKQHETSSPAEVLNIAREDLLMSKLARNGATLTLDVVRQALGR